MDEDIQIFTAQYWRELHVIPILVLNLDNPRF